MSQEVASPAIPLPENRRLRGEIATAGIHQYKVALRLGISETRLSGMLSGRLPLPPEMPERIRAALQELVA